MYVSKGKPEKCTPYIFQTNEPRITKIGVGLPGPNLTTCAKFGSEQLAEGGVTQAPFYVDFAFFFFSLFFDWATDRTVEPILMADGANEVFSHKEVPFGGHVDM
jgi:hypothetical protein